MSEKPKTPIVDMMQEQTFAALIETLLPKVTPMIGPMKDKLASYLGDNEKVIIVRRSNNKSDPSVMVLDNNHRFELVGGENKSLKFDTDDEGRPKALVEFLDIGEFISAMLSGKFNQ